MDAGNRTVVGIFAAAVALAIGAVAWLALSGSPRPEEPKTAGMGRVDGSTSAKPRVDLGKKAGRTPPKGPRERPKPPMFELAGLVLGPDGAPAPGATVVLYEASRESVGQVRASEAPAVERVNPEVLREVFALTVEEAGGTAWYTGVPALPETAPDPREVGRATAGEDGKFLFRLKEKGPFRIEAHKEGAGHAVASDVSPGGTPVVLKLGSASSLPGRVVGAEGGPIAGASVVVRSARIARTAKTAADGSFAILDIPPGKYSLTAGAPGLAPVILPSVEAPPPGGPVEVVLGAGCAVRIVVMKYEDPPPGFKRRTGNVLPPTPPVDGAVVVLYHPQSDSYRSGVTSAEGVARIDRLGPGLWRVGAHKDGFGVGFTRDVQFKPGASGEEGREIRLVPAVETPLRILAEDGRPLRGVRIYTGGEDEDFDEKASRLVGQTDDDGVVKFTFDDAVPWKSVVWVVPEDGAVAKAEPEDIGSPDEVKVVVRPGRTVQGTMRDMTGRGLPGVKVKLEVTDDDNDVDIGLYVYTDAHGNYRFPTVPYGEVTIEGETEDGDWDIVDVEAENRENPLVRDIRLEGEQPEK